jgi:hypothetical protein
MPCVSTPAAAFLAGTGPATPVDADEDADEDN